MAPLVCTVGDLLEDVAVRLSGPLPFDDDAPALIGRRRGGSAANVAVAVVRAGGRARFAGRVGADPVGDRLLAELAAEGVESRVQRAGRTGSVVSLVHPGGERTMLSDRGSAPAYDDRDVSLLAGAACLHLPGYSLAEGPLADTCRSLASAAAAGAVPVTVDASAVSIVSAIGSEPFRRLLAELRVATLFANRAEAEALRLLEPPPEPRLVVVKRGPDPALLIEPDGRRLEVPALPVAGPLDTTGAGDAFAAGFLLAWLQGAPPPEAAASGHARAAATIGAGRRQEALA